MAVSFKSNFKSIFCSAVIVSLTSGAGIARAQDNTNSVTVNGTTYTYGENAHGTSLDVTDARGIATGYQYKENQEIINHGGPTNKTNPNGGTENKRFEIRQSTTASSRIKKRG